MKAKGFRVFSFLLLLAMLFAAAAPVAAQPSLKAGGNVEESPNGVYIVQMLDAPVVAYEGGIAGLKATKPAEGKKVDPLSPAVVKYTAYLNGKHAGALNKVGGNKLYDYDFSYNGFAAQLTVEQANKLAAVDGVVQVSPDAIYTIDTSSTPAFLGLTEKGGLWDQLGGFENAGEGIIIGVVDSGIWPESLSFSDRVDANGIPTYEPTAKLAFQQIPGWHGKCTPGENFNASMCNQKLIGAQWFNAAWGGDAALEEARPWEFMSARDYNGHGSHTSFTSGGNHGFPVTGPAAAFGAISGMAPRARVAMYKALWSTETGDTASGATADLVAAIDQAVADGVDVINYSISGTQTNFADAVEISYLYAAQAGIFVAESAGNSGPTPSTVAHPAPWTTTVAAGTHNRAVLATVTLGNGVVYTGVSTATSSAGPAPLINSTSAGLAGADANQVRQCFSGTLDPAVVTGKIVVCERGGAAPNNARVDKSLAVFMAGGVGMVQINVSATGSLNADFHSVPSVHLASTYLAPVEAYAATPGATATISKAYVDLTAPAPYTASFSSRGPLLAGGGNLLKPDLIAPGQDILASVSPMTSGGLDFALYSGTSMSSPHVAGLAALFKARHPDWTPMMIKSALMTTAYNVLGNSDDVLNTGDPTSPMVIFAQGAGHVKPNAAVDPGLVFKSGWNDWLAFLCGTTTGVVNASSCTILQNAGFATDPSNFNGASLAVAGLTYSKTFTRTVTNVGAKGTYDYSVTGLAGLNISVSPASFTLDPGKSQKLSITVTQVSAPLNVYTGGYITWSDGTHSVRIPVVVKPVALAAPAAVSGTGGEISYDVTFGYSGTFTTEARGLIPAVITAGTVADDPTDGSCSLASPNAQLIPVTIPAGTTYARFSLFDADVKSGSDIDLCVFRGTTLVGSSGSGTSAEEVNLLNPRAAAYTVVVQGWGVDVSSPFKLHTWLLGTANAGNMTISAPTTAVMGQMGTIHLAFSGLAASTKYLGSVAYGGVDGMPNPTIVRVDMP